MNQGMAKQNIFERFELLFWNLAISVLSSSRNARASLSPVFQAVQRSKTASMSILFALCGMAGLVSGYLFFVVTH